MEKPFGMIVAPQPIAPGGANAQLASELSQGDADRAMLAELKASQVDQIGGQFGGGYYKTFYRFLGATFRHQPLEVTRFYPDRQVAVDIFPRIEREEQEEIDYKRGWCQGMGIRYVALSEETSELTDVIAQIGLGG